MEVGIYADRIEVISPGPFLNSMTIEKMIAGLRFVRNPIWVGMLRNYGYADARGMGARTKVIPLMKAGKPVLEAIEDYVKTVAAKISK